MMGSVVPVKRPPHNFFFVKSSLDMVEEKNRVRDGGVCGGYEATLIIAGRIGHWVRRRRTRYAGPPAASCRYASQTVCE